ncbi:MAG: hypothetical protein AAGK32_15630, partial [Actinomycetota bacterium]
RSSGPGIGQVGSGRDHEGGGAVTDEPGLAPTRPGRSRGPMTAVGEPVPALRLLDDRGDPWELAGDRDRPELIVFHRHFY